MRVFFLNLYRKIPLALALASGLWLAVWMILASFHNQTQSVGASWNTAVGCIGLIVSLVLYLINRLRKRVSTLTDFALIILHVGLIGIFGGELLNEMLGERGFVFLREGQSTNRYIDYDERDQKLPFTLTLHEFKAVAYSDSLRVKDYLSTLSVDDASFELAVNTPRKIRGWQIFQHDCGVELSAQSNINLTVTDEKGQARALRASFSEPFVVNNATTGVVLDFVPSAMPAGSSILTSGKDVLLSPAVLIRLENDYGQSLSKWLFMNHEPRAMQLGDATLAVASIENVQYTVLSVVRMPYDSFVFGGILLACLGLFVFVFPKKRENHEHRRVD